MNWASIAATIKSAAIGPLGTTGNLVRVVAHGTLDLNTGVISPDVLQLFPVFLVMTGRKDLFGTGGVLSRVWSGSAVIAAGGTEPLAGDMLIVGTNRYTVGEIIKVAPDGATVVVYEIELRG